MLERYPDAVVSSGRRSAQRNRLVGGVANSYHLKGRAADVVVPREQTAAFIEAASTQRVSRWCTGPEELVDEGDHIHIAW